MKLHYKPPECVSRAVKDKICYCVPYDRSLDGKKLSGGFITVTGKELIISDESGILRRFLYSECEDIFTVAQVGGGILAVKINGEETICAVYSSKHNSRIATAARGAALLMKGENRLLENREYERTCEKCGRALPGTRHCPKCDGGGMIMLKRIIDVCKNRKGMFAAIAVLMIVVSLVVTVQPEVQQRFIDSNLAKKNGTVNDVLIFIAVTASLTAAQILLDILKNYACALMGSYVCLDLRDRIFKKLQRLPLSFITDRRPGMLMNRLMRNTDVIKMFIQNSFGQMVTAIIIMITSVCVMVTINPLLTLLSVILMPVIFLISFGWRKNINRRFHAQWKKEDKSNSALQDVISGIRVVKSFGKEASEAGKFDEINHEFAEVQKKNEVFWASFYPILIFIMGLGVYLVTYMGGIGVLNSDMSVGELTQFIAYTGLLFNPLSWITNLPRMVTETTTSLERIYDILDEEPPAPSENPVEPESLGDIEFQNVTFGYHSYEPVLENISLKVKKGEMIGIVGASGTGKSTLINLIMRLYSPDSGRILIDGNDLNDINPDIFHKKMGVVLQETFLFSGTILNNLRFSKPDATYEEVIKAAKMANAHDFIMKTPDGYNTYVGEHGYNLSGGERQRIAIARAVLVNPDLLILDEATSNLDTESEYLIQKALARLTGGRTTFAIAHRLSTLKDADRLIVIDGHNIVEEGTHNELMKKGGIYYGLVTAQLEMQTLKAMESDSYSEFAD